MQIVNPCVHRLIVTQAVLKKNRPIFPVLHMILYLFNFCAAKRPHRGGGGFGTGGQAHMSAPVVLPGLHVGAASLKPPLRDSAGFLPPPPPRPLFPLELTAEELAAQIKQQKLKQHKNEVPAMLETAAPIGLSWAPKPPSLATTSSTSKSEPAPKLGTTQGSLWKPPSELVDWLFVPSRDPKKVDKLTRKSVKDTTGKGWFDMLAPTIIPELKKDLEILQLRHVMDPKRHFKREGKSKALPKYFQVGTVVEHASEFYSGRMTRRERKTTLVDELLSDQSLKSYRMCKVRDIQESRTPGGNQKWKNKGKQTLKRAKDRRK